MKKTKIISLCFLVIMGLISCKQKNVQGVTTTEQGKMAKTEQSDFDNFLANYYNNEEVIKEVMDSAKVAFEHFQQLRKAEKDEEALDFYLTDIFSFILLFESSTDNFEFQRIVIIPMLFKFKDVDTACKKTISILEALLLRTEGVILLSDGKNVPSHYGELLSTLGQLYIDVEEYEKAIAMTDKMLELINNDTDSIIYEHALIYHSRAIVYTEMKDNASALKFVNLAISILEELQLQDEKLYSNCQSLIADINRADAEQGDATAQYNLGVCYGDGVGVTQDYSQAAHWFRQAAEQGHAFAQHSLGNSYFRGYGVTKDLSQAVYWYRKAAEQGIMETQCNLGICYYNGYGVTQDYNQAVHWLRKAAEQGDVTAQRGLAGCYMDGNGVTKDDKQAVYWFRKAAEQGHTAAQYSLGLCYYKGDGVTEDDSQAVYWWKKAAEQEHADAQYNLGLCYKNGYGVTKDDKQAEYWLQKAAEQGVPK